MRTKINLRLAAPEDIQAIAEWPPYAGVLAQMDYALRRNGWLDEFFGRPGAACFVAEAGGSIIGFALLRGTGKHSAEVRIALHPDRTGQGLGKSVMLAVLEKGFSDPDLTRIDLIVRKNNEPAMKLYSKLGFVARGVSRHVIQGNVIDFFDMDISRQDLRKFRNGEAGQ